ncbi:MAG TPA: HEAT repeat domain-containing protein, partial [Nitrospiraceae bacterium]|nr:HEAT repeat domain-containing protein [Nitrospiraceae bacterium]
MMMRAVQVATVAVWLGIAWFPTEVSWAYREYFTQEQRDQLAKAQTVLVEVIVITDKGAVPAEALAETVRRRLEEVGYTVVTDPAQPHDVHFRVKCEQRKTWEGTTPSGGDADLPDSPSRVWKGPA